MTLPMNLLSSSRPLIPSSRYSWISSPVAPSARRLLISRYIISAHEALIRARCLWNQSSRNALSSGVTSTSVK